MNKTAVQFESLIDFEHFHRVLNNVDLYSCAGSVVKIAGLTVESVGPKVAIGELCSIETENGKIVQAEVIGFKNNNVVLLPLEYFEGISPGDKVRALKTPRTIAVGRGLLGRVLDGLGRPIDGKANIALSETRPVDNKSPSPLSREKIALPLATGIKSIDGMLTCGKGQRIGIFAGSGVGKSVLLGELANGSTANVNVLCLVGERGREVRHFLEDELGPEGLRKSVIIVATSDAPAIQRVKAAFAAVTIAEYFRDLGQDVLFMMDSLTRFAQAQREIGLAAGEPPASKGYTPSVFALLPRLLERLGCSDSGSITGMLTVLAEGDDMNDPVADSARSLLDGHIVLSRKLAQRGHYPAIDILQSISRLMPLVTSGEHRKAASLVREAYSTYHDAEDLINIGAFAPGSNKRIDKSIALIDKINGFLIQPARQKSSFESTIKELTVIASGWQNLVN